MPLNEGAIIDQLALYERSIDGIRNSANYASNPDSLTIAQLPAVLHYIPEFTMEQNRHHLGFKTTLSVRSILLAVPRETKAGQLKFLENSVIPFGQKWRAKFSDPDVINAISAATGGIKVWLTKGNYGAGDGDNLLSFGNTNYLGYVMEFIFTDS